ncbi:DNA cytosine methyltransferase [Methylobacterium sp. 22177]|uniref:DNA cytosine methyltransferase n=1 Tax=Methylobacterium sp. 22177 TaxID=3453885 RepID=UPI003F86E414
MARIKKTGVIQAKLARLQSGQRPRVLDLFAGCGGISLGFSSAGFQINAAVEIDEIAARTHALNFHNGLGRAQRELHGRARDITTLEPGEITEELKLGGVDMAFDVVVGGPPCQAYARVGRAKLREVADHPSAFKIDPRGNLYLRYVHFVRAVKPLAILMENVPDVLNYGGHNVMGEVAEVLEDLGYEARYSLINSAFHGVPQMRDRVFLIAIHKDLGVEVEFPRATHHMILPSGYDGTRSVALRNIDLFGGGGFVEADHGDQGLPGPVTCRDALGDLAPITLHLEGKLRRGARRLDEPAAYPEIASISTYARRMREWPGFEAPVDGVRDHVIRYLPRDASIFREMPNGGEYPAAHATAVNLWRQHIANLERRSGKRLKEDEKQTIYRAMVPPYPVHTFPNRWWKLRPDFPSRTLMAHIGKDTYSHIHYDSRQARVISVREAARLQSFPDGFVFCGTMNPAYRQIGNAVPPLMAEKLALTIRAALARACTLLQGPPAVAAE